MWSMRMLVRNVFVTRHSGGLVGHRSVTNLRLPLRRQVGLVQRSLVARLRIPSNDIEHDNIDDISGHVAKTASTECFERISVLRAYARWEKTVRKLASSGSRMAPPLETPHTHERCVIKNGCYGT